MQADGGLTIGGILLAAGRSRRFGADKLTQVLPGGDQWVAEQSAAALARAVNEVVAVVRPGQGALENRLAALGVSCLTCADSACGMGHSLAHGVRATAAWSGWIIMLADMPFIQWSSIAAVADAVRAGASIAAPSHKGRRGHPVGFNRRFFRALSELRGDTGARGILAAYTGEIIEVPCDDPGVVLDVDTPADLSALQN